MKKSTIKQRLVLAREVVKQLVQLRSARLNEVKGGLKDQCSDGDSTCVSRFTANC